MTKHTEGPWLIRESRGDSRGNATDSCRQWVIDTDFKPFVALLEEWKTAGNPDAWEEGRANARLIAAAPELYEALAACHDLLLMNPRYENGRAMRMAAAALDKAEGK